MNSLWVVTSYFNPCGWQSRARNYRAFRRHLAAPLLTVEWHPDGRFELGPGDADLLVQVRGGDPMWQKERLLNLGLGHLPPEARHVAWVDADVVFLDPNWAERTVEALEHCEVLQPFAWAHYLDPVDTARLAAGGVAPGAVSSATGVVSAARLAAEVGPQAVAEADLRGLEDAALPGNGQTLPRSPGLAWAARRSVLEDLGLYDRAVIGSGDLLWTMGVLGVGTPWLDGASSRGFSYLARSGYRAWAERAARRVGGRVGHLEAGVLHLHGGELADRRYKARHHAFDALGLDVDRDLRLDPGGAWAWVDPQPRWTRFFEAYFRDREEDRGFVP